MDGKTQAMPNDASRPDDRSESADAPGTWFDDATGLPGRAFWQAVLSAESARCARFQRPATIVLAQAIGFADVVRLWGVDAAERSIADVGMKLRSGCRASDYVARLGDDRLGLILTETDEIAAINMVERVRAQCDRVMAARAAGGRMAFGWASATTSSSLLEAVATAEDRLASDTGGD